MRVQCLPLANELMVIFLKENKMSKETSLITYVGDNLIVDQGLLLHVVVRRAVQGIFGSADHGQTELIS